VTPAATAAPLRAFRLEGARLFVCDQRALPDAERWLSFGPTLDEDGVEGVARAIETLAVRGAPAIGGVAASALGLLAAHATATTPAALTALLEAALARLWRTRPTAVNLHQALGRVQASWRDSAQDGAAGAGGAAALAALRLAVGAAAAAVVDEDAAACAAIGAHGAALLHDGDTVLTICHTGALATCGQGTALGVIKSARANRKDVSVLALETRPLWQGARLTAWECLREGIPVTLLTDGMAAFALARRKVACAIVGADRIAENGDTANKIGTYQLAVACAHHGVPFYVAAPSTTFDAACPDGAAIPIEERAADEVRRPRDALWAAPPTVPVWNPAFDVTPASLIRGFITEQGVVAHPAQLSR
jgi:methylthioribose-1-phosphate isomerase